MIRDDQRRLIREFLESITFTGEVLDFGCDLAPYRDIVERTATWHGFNRVSYPSGHKKENIGPDDVLRKHWDTILCTQVLQYVPYPQDLLRKFSHSCDRLVLTYATNWPEVEPEDFHRFTKTGMTFMLLGWTIERHEQLGTVAFEGEETMALGYGVVARP